MEDSSIGQAGSARRKILTGMAAAALGLITAETLADATPAQATQGAPILLGQDNTGATAATGVANNAGESALLASGGDGAPGIGVAGTGTGIGVAGTGGGTGVQGTGITGVLGQGVGAGTGVQGMGGPNDGFGVVGQGFGQSAGVAGTGGANNGVGVAGGGGGAGYGVSGQGGPSDGVGVIGQGQGFGDGVQGETSKGHGVRGYTTNAAGVGVRAENGQGGTALQVFGPAVFSRSGVLTVPAGSSAVTKTGVALTAASLILATLQQSVAGVWVGSAKANVAGNSFTIHLNKTVPTSTKVAWFIVNLGGVLVSQARMSRWPSWTGPGRPRLRRPRPARARRRSRWPETRPRPSRTPIRSS